MSAISGPILWAVLNHLWQSTLFAGAAAGLALLLRRSRARVRYLAWLAASMKFLVPFGWLTALGAQIPWPAGAAPAGVSMAGQMMETILRPGGPGSAGLAAAAHGVSSGNALLTVLTVLWALGAAAVGARWLLRWRALRCARLASTPAGFPFVIPVRRCAPHLEPAVAGVLRPVLLLPQGLEQRLAPAELDAVLAHERCHVLWRDNLAAALHMLVEALFWFHPLIWWLGVRIVAERERACDEQVLAEGHAPVAYAEGILKVCEHFLQTGVPCAAGVGGGSLKHRIEEIMNKRLIERLSGLHKACIIGVAAVAVAAPLAVGLLGAPRAHAQDTAAADTPALTNFSIQRAVDNDPQHVSFLFMQDKKLRIRGATLLPLISFAYDVQNTQVFGRQWGEEPRYDITADCGAGCGPTPAAAAAIRDLLTSRFGLVVKHQLRQQNGYVLMISSTGSKLTATQFTQPTPRGFWITPSEGDPSSHTLKVNDIPMKMMAAGFGKLLQATVADETGLQGDYTFKYQVSIPAASPPDPALLAQTLRQQLGLTLEARPLNIDTIEVVSAKAPQEVLAQR